MLSIVTPGTISQQPSTAALSLCRVFGIKAIDNVRFAMAAPCLDASKRTAQCALSRQTIRRKRNETARFTQRDAVGFFASSDIPSRERQVIYLLFTCTTGPKPSKIDRYLKHNNIPIYGTVLYINTHKPHPLAALVAEALATQHKPSQDK
jgi:hypothetical protein